MIRNNWYSADNTPTWIMFYYPQHFEIERRSL